MSDDAIPVLLGGYAAKRCPVRVHNDYSPSVPTVPWEPSPEDQARFDAGLAFEAEVVAMFIAALPGTVVVDASLRKAEAIAETVRLMDERTPVILGGWLPDDHVGGRTGRPDLLIRAGDGYVPGDVKHHSTVKPTKTTTATVSALDAPADLSSVSGWSSATNHRPDDGMQLAHYTRLLQACGRHAGPDWLIGGIIGTSTVEPGGPLVLVWHNLAEPLIDTFSRSAGKKKRSLLDRHDHEHGFRVKVAERALLITGQPDDPEPLVTPIGQAECDTCPYSEYCASAMGDDDPSYAITMGRLDRREWLTLRALGVDSTNVLADLDPDDDDWFDTYAVDVTHHTPAQARKRLAAAVDRAGMIRAGVTHYKTVDGPIEVPEATVEIDIDNENDLNHRVYMWGARVRQGTDETTAVYRAFTDWEPLTDETERALAQQFVDWLRDQRAAAEAEGGSLLVFHWSHPEWSKLHKILGEEAVADLTGEDGVFCDIEKVFKTQFASLRGTSVKKIAPLYGFSWQVDDPGGAISQTYYATAITSTDPAEVEAAKAWLLAYNEDDNAAVAAARDGMRREHSVTRRDGRRSPLPNQASDTESKNRFHSE